jgi:phage terminase large subunit GpA-like protein
VTAPLLAKNWSDEEIEVWTPPEDVTISEWAGKYRELSKQSAIKGRYSLDMVPFLVPVMDDCCDPNVDEVGCSKPAQIGGTDGLLVNVAGYYCDQESATIMIVLADEDSAKYVNTEKLHEMFKASHHLRRFWDPKRFNNEEIKLINGARIYIGWASSVSRLGTKTCRITIGDEIDKPGWFRTSKEAGAMSLLRERANTYPLGLRKHIWFSTPTNKKGNITVLMESFDIVYDWHVPCPHCGQFQPLRWSDKHQHGFEDALYRAEDGSMHRLGHVHWEGGRNATREQILETACYICGECGATWSTVQKNNAVRNGKRLPRTEPKGNERRRFTHLNRLLSLFDGGRLEVLIQNWVDIFKIKDPADRRKDLQGFINSTLAEPFEEVTISTTENKILKARVDLPPMTAPRDVVAVTAGIDVQLYKFWFCVRAWLNSYTSWLIHYGELATWHDVEELLFGKRYPIQNCSDVTIPIWRAAIDTGGGKKFEDMSMTEETQRWIRANGVGRGCRVWGTRGATTSLVGKVKIGKVLDRYPSGKPIKGGLQIITLDTHKLKDMHHYRLGQALKQGDQAAYLHSGVKEDYAQHVLAEEKQRDEKGVEHWVHIGGRNDLLDADLLCQIVADPEWPGGGVNLMTSFVENVIRGKKSGGLNQVKSKFMT